MLGISQNMVASFCKYAFSFKFRGWDMDEWRYVHFYDGVTGKLSENCIEKE